MYAVIETGGKQYKVAPNQLVQVDKLDNTEGETVNFPVLFFKPSEGEGTVQNTLLSQITVKATVMKQCRGEKIRIIKFRRRKHSRKQMGHRQYHTVLKINEIGG